MGSGVLSIAATWELQERVSQQAVRFGDPTKVGYAGELGDENILKLKPRLERTCRARITGAEALKIAQALGVAGSGGSIVVRGGGLQVTGWFQLTQDDAGYLIEGRVGRMERF